jgi:hypothetical protein
MSGFADISQRPQALLDIFLSRDLPFLSMIEGKVESKMPTRPAQPKTKFLLSNKGIAGLGLNLSPNFRIMVTSLLDIS